MKIGLIIFLFLMQMTSALAAKKTYNIVTPTLKLEASKAPLFLDDLDFGSMKQAISRQMDAFKRQPLKGTIKFGEKSYPLSVMKSTLLKFDEILDQYNECLKVNEINFCKTAFDRSVKASFDFYIPKSVVVENEETGASAKNNVHFTAYYSPIFDAKKEKDDEYAYAIYKLPKSDSLRRLTREEIVFDNKLDGYNLELYYVKDIFGLYLLHIEGGGAVKLVGDKSEKIRYISYAGHNSNKFEFISKYMVNNGMINDHSVYKQRRYLENNPEQWREIYSFCKGFIYFQETKSEPLGLENIPLTDNRSIAQDKKYYPRKGILSFISAKRPVLRDGEIRSIPLNRFYIDQDTGGAIKGEARADIYFGFGDEAELSANHLNTYGQMIFLVTKNP